MKFKNWLEQNEDEFRGLVQDIVFSYMQNLPPDVTGDTDTMLSMPIQTIENSLEDILNRAEIKQRLDDNDLHVVKNFVRKNLNQPISSFIDVISSNYNKTDTDSILSPSF